MRRWATTLGKAEVEITEQEVPGAEAARLFEIVSPPRKSANGGATCAAAAWPAERRI